MTDLALTTNLPPYEKNGEVARVGRGRSGVGVGCVETRLGRGRKDQKTLLRSISHHANFRVTYGQTDKNTYQRTHGLQMNKQKKQTSHL